MRLRKLPQQQEAQQNLLIRKTTEIQWLQYDMYRLQNRNTLKHVATYNAAVRLTFDLLS